MQKILCVEMSGVIKSLENYIYPSKHLAKTDDSCIKLWMGK